ncbi:MAG: hypothetical protein RBS39_10130 [Phycisphaerales bacterium]|jgi:MYXO-CTERM domain-containing protein|nr:hypothetical protein [Phycisphaerales bacterium]
MAGPAFAQYVPGEALVNPSITGNTQYDGWIGLTSGNYPGYGAFPGSAAWPAPIGSNRTLANTFNSAEPGDAGLIKLGNGTGGGPYPAGQGIYFGGFSAEINNNGGTLAVTDSTPVADLRNVIFQVQIGEAWTFDFFNHEMPTLSFNGGSQQLAATTSLTLEQFYNGTVDMPTGPEDVFINTYLLQWDLSGIAMPITDFSVSFTGVQHAQLYGLQLNQSDVYTRIGRVRSPLGYGVQGDVSAAFAAIPAPGALSLVGLGGLVAMRRRR